MAVNVTLTRYWFILGIYCNKLSSMSDNINRRSALKAAGALGAAGLTTSIAGCADLLGGDEDARVGVLQPATGDLGDLGEPIQDAGVLPGTQLDDEDVDYEIDIRREDTETDPEVGIDRAQALADAGYPSVTGAASSSVTIQVAEEVYFEEEIVGISPASTSPDITDMDGDYLLRTCPSDAFQTQVLAELAYDGIEDLGGGLEVASVLYEDGDYGEGVNDAFVDNFEDKGGNVVAEEAFEEEQGDYSSELTTVLDDVDQDPDVLLLVGYPDSGEQIFIDFYENYDADDYTILVTDGLQSNDLPADVDNEMSNVIGTAPAAEGEGYETFEQLFEDEYDSSPGVFTAEAYDATAVHILAQLRADELTGEAVSEQVREVTSGGGEEITPDNLAEGVDLAADGEEIEYVGASSAVEFDDDGDLDIVEYDIFDFDMDGFHVQHTMEL